MTTPDFVDSDKKTEAEKPDLAPVLKDALEHPDEPPLSGGSKYARLKFEVEERTAVLQDQAEQAFFERMEAEPVEPKKPSRFLGLMENLFYSLGSIGIILGVIALFGEGFSLVSVLTCICSLVFLLLGAVFGKFCKPQEDAYETYIALRERDVEIQAGELYRIEGGQIRSAFVMAPKNGTYYALTLTEALPERVSREFVMEKTSEADVFGRYPVYRLKADCVLAQDALPSEKNIGVAQRLVERELDASMKTLELLLHQPGLISQARFDAEVLKPFELKLTDGILFDAAMLKLELVKSADVK